jgi:hypothetical protein
MEVVTLFADVCLESCLEITRLMPEGVGAIVFPDGISSP